MTSRTLCLLTALLMGCPSAEQAPGSDNPWASPPGSNPEQPDRPPILDVAGSTGAGMGEGLTPATADGCQPAAYAREAHPAGGPTVTLSGTVSGLSAQGSMIIELVRPNARMSVYGFACPVSADFSLPIPAELGEVGLAVFLDSNGNGPDTADAAGRVSGFFEVGTEDITGLSIAVSDPQQLGDLSPPYTMPNAPRDDLPAGQGGEGETPGPAGDEAPGSPPEPEVTGGDPPPGDPLPGGPPPGDGALPPGNDVLPAGDNALPAGGGAPQ
jgi:hypothetical protein